MSAPAVNAARGSALGPPYTRRFVARAFDRTRAESSLRAVATSALVALGSVGGAAPAAGAQAVRVTVRDAERGQPVSQAVVVLRRAGGGADTAVAGRGVTTPAGVRLLGAGAGAYRVEVRRIGQQPFVGPVVRLAAADTAEVTVQVPNRPLSLAGVVVTGANVCGSPTAPDVIALWTAAQTALAASGEPRPGLVRRAVRIERTLDHLSANVRERRTVLDTAAAEALVPRSLPPAVVEREGLVRGRIGTQAWFYGPDARLLLSEEFARTHCFGPAHGSGSAQGWVGIRFTPVPGRRVPDVTGMFWLDSATAEPRRVVFSYELPGVPWDDRELGGEVDFGRAPTGEWLVRRWRIRTPLLSRAQSAARSAGYSETEVRAEWDSAAPPAAAPPARVRVAGTVFDSLLAAPLAGAVVTRDGAPGVAVTDSLGRFALDSVEAGPGRFVVSHPGLDSAGLSDLPMPVDLTGAPTGGLTGLRLATPSRATLWARLCGGELPPAAAAGVLYGVVRDAATGALVPAARTEVRWVAVDSAPTGAGPAARAGLRLRPEVRESVADSAGLWGACGLPLGEGLDVRAAAPGTESGPAAYALGPRGVARLDLWTPPAAAAGTAGAVATGAVVGVVRDTAGRPRPDAAVRLTGVGLTGAAEREARTDAAGRFRLDGLPLGTGTLLVRSVGLAPQRVPVVVRPGEPEPVEVTVRRVAVLAGVTVRAARPRASGLLSELDGRRRMRLGFFVDTALMRRTQNVRQAFVDVPFGEVRTNGTRWALFFAETATSKCQSRVVVDGVPSDWDHVNVLSPDEILAVEVYRRGSQVPLQYQDLRSLCGAVLIWTDRMQR